MSGEIIVFGTDKLRKTDRVKLSRSLYGYIDRSFHNKYAYLREGILDRTPHIRPLDRRAVLVTKSSDAPKVIQLLREHGAQIYARRIQLEEDDIQILSREFREPPDPSRDQDEDRDEEA